MSETDDSFQADTVIEDDTDLKEPTLYRVLLLNDDYTHQQFVVAVLQSIFRKALAEAERIMLTVHYKGRGVCGIYPKEIAETKMEQVHQRARADGFPLRCTIEEV
jgi:ATP-dependent Clp protease adaptor protein ClpS